MSLKLSEHFTNKEFFSKNDPGPWKVDRPDMELIDLLEKLRNMLEEPILINSGVRSQAYNDSLPGSSKMSGHIYGKAADIAVKGMSQEKLGEWIHSMWDAQMLPMLRYAYCIKGSKSAVHVGVDDRGRKHIWGPGFGKYNDPGN